ncbi:hypothetical protein Q31b_10050 [Novipirellula aureliae]|uniref:Uncharacterized protein n=1 Tax=Novipirellula aureliae TaxID=2527966 RepID=A0A5C6EF33_9BACT|nr:hypothetical protein Q31b_10050 [Novipirellula aureliae]
MWGPRFTSDPNLVLRQYQQLRLVAVDETLTQHETPTNGLSQHDFRLGKIVAGAPCPSKLQLEAATETATGSYPSKLRREATATKGSYPHSSL